MRGAMPAGLRAGESPTGHNLLGEFSTWIFVEKLELIHAKNSDCGNTEGVGLLVTTKTAIQVKQTRDKFVNRTNYHSKV
jgi:hypothetical protein